MTALARWWYVVGGLLAVGHLALPLGVVHDLNYVAVAAGAYGLGVVAVVRHRPVPRRPWCLLVAGLGTWLLGDAAWALASDIGLGASFPPWADVFYLVGYALLVAGLVGISRRRIARGYVEAILDALIVGTVVALVFFVAFVAPAWADAGQASPDLVVDLAYMVFDAVLVVRVAHLARVEAGTRTALRLVGLAFCAVLVGDVLRNVAVRVPAVAETPHLVDGWWLLAYLLLGAAFVHPSMATFGRAPLEVREPEHLNVAQVTTLGVIALALPAVLLAEVALGREPDVLAVGVASVAVIALVCVRLVVVAHRMREQSAALRRLAGTDSLTGLANGVAFAAALRMRLGAAGEGSRVAVVLVGLDRCTEIADTLGYRIGDGLLRAAAERLRACVGDEGIAARMGGEAFAVLVEVDADDTDALAWATRIRAALATPFTVSEGEVTVDALGGVGVAPDDGADVDELLQRADVALVAARARSDRVARYSGRMSSDGALTPHLATELPAALAAGQVVVHFQPQVEVSTGRVRGVEALVRWQHPVHGLLPPAAFVPAAERTGLIRPLTRYVLDRALAQAAEWRAEGRDLAVSVNLSAHDLLDPETVARVGDVLGRHGLEPGSLELEITETMAMVDPERSLGVLRGLAHLGVVLSVDDYGTGYSSLAYLQRLPVQRLKIDRSFVMGVVEDGPSAAIVRSTIELARNLGMTVVAEGVEDDATLMVLRDMGCDAAQGFGLGRPVPAARVPELIGTVEARVPRVLRQLVPVGQRVV